MKSRATENWYVLFVNTIKEDTLVKFISSKKVVEIFSAKLEYYRRDSKSIQIKSLFPGYLFVRTEKNQPDFDDFIRGLEFKSGIWKQLKYSDISALTIEEITVLERLLDDQGILRMSYGKLVNNKLVITKGPLVGYDPYIYKFNKHDRLVYLDLSFLDQKWKAGCMLDCEE